MKSKSGLKMKLFTSVQCGNVPMLEAKIYSQADIFSELRLQRSEQGSNLASFPGTEDGNEAR